MDARVARVKRRLSERMGPHGEPIGFCGQAQVKKPKEAYFAVPGEEETLPVEYGAQPPRRGGDGGVNKEWGKEIAATPGGEDILDPEGER